MKTLFFLPIILFFGFFLLLVIGFFVLIAKLIKKSKNSEWEGTVVDKLYFEKEDEGRKEDYYTLVVDTKERQMKVGVARSLYDQFKVGDKIKKPMGKLIPEKG